MGALSDLFKSERGLVLIAIIAAATVLTALDRLSTADWTAFVKFVFAAYVAGKTVTGAVAIRAARQPDAIPDDVTQAGKGA